MFTDNSIVTEKIREICIMNGAQRREFVRNHRTCVFGYPRKAHGPSMSCVYYVMDGDDILVSSMLGRAKPKAVKRSGRVSLCILDEKWPPTYITVYGNATVEERRCVIRVKPESTFETPPRHVYNPNDVHSLSHSYGTTLDWNAE